MLDLVAALLLVGSDPTFLPKACVDNQVAARARCGTVKVPEDRSRSQARQIGLNVIVIPARQRQDPPQALFDLDGGPGLADTKNAAFYLTDGTAYSAKRDIVLVDQRGTGGSNPLDCPEFDATDRALQPMFSVDTVRSCCERLSKVADLTRYTTDDAVADLDAVREALGYERIDLFALSYGTTLAMRYIANHGDKVRSAVLLSAVPPSAVPPRHHATVAQQVLDQSIADCAADAPCAEHFPSLEGDLKQAIARLRSNGRIDPRVAMERLRTRLYSASGARQLPWTIRRLAEGDDSILASANERAGFNYYDGVYLTITCSESLPWFDVPAAAARSRQTIFGDYRLERQAEACAHWPRAELERSFFEPLRSSVPILFISGGRDPVTPASWASEAARTLDKARHVVIPWGGHIVDGLSGLDSCLDQQILRFLDTAEPNSVDAQCFAAMTPPPFKLEEAAQLSR